MKLLPILTALSIGVTQIAAWGVDGHKIVATIAQIHLHPSAKQALCNVLPLEAKCHLAPVAAWADTIKWKYPGTGVMHYINPLGDKPGETCAFGEEGWTNDKVNVVTAIHEKTRNLLNGTFDRANEEDLKFLIHFMGDMHQPLHLTGYLRGGNDAWVNYFGRRQRLHSVWDGSILLNKIANLGNYTSSTGNAQIESALLGNIFDPYVRFIVKEGIWGWWKESSKSWFECPKDGEHFPLNNETIKGSEGRVEKSWESARHAVLGGLPSIVQAVLVSTGVMSPLTPPGFTETVTAAMDGWSPACPYTWGKQLHPFNCRYVWPKDWHNGIELDDGEYFEKIRDDKVMEQVLGMAGIRLAAVLNAIYADEAVEGAKVGPYFVESA